jgi:hypothetical protein
MLVYTSIYSGWYILVYTMDFLQYQLKWCQFGLTPQSLYNRHLWCHYRNECIPAPVPETLILNIKKTIVLPRLTLPWRMQGTRIRCRPSPASECVLAFTIDFWVFQHQFMLHTIFQASSPYQTVQTCSSLVLIASAVTVTAVWRDCGRNTDLTSQGLFCCLQSSNLWFVSLFRRNLDEVEQCCYQ